eukprot:ANDGO_06413.mRNA.1 hypothetical protein
MAKRTPTQGASEASSRVLGQPDAADEVAILSSLVQRLTAELDQTKLQLIPSLQGHAAAAEYLRRIHVNMTTLQGKYEAQKKDVEQMKTDMELLRTLKIVWESWSEKTSKKLDALERENRELKTAAARSKEMMNPRSSLNKMDSVENVRMSEECRILKEANSLLEQRVAHLQEDIRRKHTVIGNLQQSSVTKPSQQQQQQWSQHSASYTGVGRQSVSVRDSTFNSFASSRSQMQPLSSSPANLSSDRRHFHKK